MTATDSPGQFTDVAHFIVHATDFSPGSELAFAHALRLALANKANLTLLHVGDNTKDEWDSFPSVRATLERWGFLDAGSRRADVSKLGITIERIIVQSNNVTDAIADYVNSHQVDMLVLATDQRHEIARWLQPSIAEKTARKLALPTLFVPSDGRGCITLEDGKVTMDQVLIPVDHEPPAREAILRGLRAITIFGNAQSKLTLLHIGSESDFPDVRIPEGSWQIARTTREGNPVSEILAAAEESAANLLIMVTKGGSDGFFEAMRGTTTEQVLRRAPCPILSIPSDY